MIVWLPWFWLLLVPLHSVTGQDQHYMGGSISFVCNSTAACRLTVITGWKLGEGPCGPTCGWKDIWRDTAETRRQMEEDHGQSYFGAWDLSGDASTMSSYVSAVNTPGGWEQEVMETDVVLGSAKQEKIRLSGLYWRRFHFNYVENISSVLHVDLNPLIRNDTGLPNNSPVVMFKPLYRIPLNKATKIVLSTMDRDGDYVWCQAPPSTLTAVKLMPKTTIYKDCSVTVEANQQDEFYDKGNGVVTLVARDYNRHGLSLGGETRKMGDTRPLSTVIVQFMVQTVKSVEGPSFLPPTRESQHVFIVYTGSVLEIPLYATAGQFNISKFQVRSLPCRPFTVTTPVTMTENGTNVFSTTVSWKPTPADVGEYLFSATAIDEKGADGPGRDYKIIAKESVIISLPRKSSNSINFMDTVEFPIYCLQYATCTVFVSIATEPVGGQVVNVTGSQESTVQVQITPPQKKNNDSYISYITFTSSTPGNIIIYLKATGPHGMQSDEYNLFASIAQKDRCEFGPCVHGVCESEKDQFSCICEEGYTGTLCDTAITIPTTTVKTTMTRTTTSTITSTTQTTTSTSVQTATATTRLTTTTPNLTTTLNTMPTTPTIKQTYTITTKSATTAPTTIAMLSTTKATTTSSTPTTTTTETTTTTTKPTTTTTTPTTTTTTSTTTKSATTTTTPTTTTAEPTTTTTTSTTTTTTPTTTKSKTITTKATTTTSTPTTTPTEPTTTTTPTSITTSPTVTTTTSTTTTTRPISTSTTTAYTPTTTTVTTTTTAIPQPSASTAPDPAVYLSATSTSGFPSCTEVVNPHPPTQCICLSGNQLIQCPSRKVGIVNSLKQDDTGSTSILVPVLGCVAGLTAGIVAIFVIKKFCCPCSKTNKVGADSLQSLKQEDEERYSERKPRAHRQHPPHHRNTPRKPRKLNPSRY